MPDTVTLVLLVVAVVLLAAVLVLLLVRTRRQPGADDEKIIRHTDDALGGLRRDLYQQNETLRTAVTDALHKSEEKTDKLSERTYEGQLRVSRALNEMQEKVSQTGKAQTEAVTAAVEKLQFSNEKKLDEMRATVDEKLTGTLNQRLDASFKTVSEQLVNVYKSLGEMKEISGGITALNRVLAGVKTRGNWAEAQLETILDQIVPGMYEKNFRPGSGLEAVEFAVRIPSSDDGGVTYMPIDSKFPMEDYLRLCDAADAADAEALRIARKALDARVLAEAKEIKKYISPPATTPFAVMYLATDSLYAEVISSKENIADRVHNDCGVLIAGPSTITALLSSLAMGFRTVALNKKAGEVMDLLAAAKGQYDKFGDVLQRAKKKIEDAGKVLEEAENRNNIIVKRLKNVESLPESEADQILETDG